MSEIEAETCKCNRCNVVFPSKEIPEGAYGAVLCADCREGLGPNVRDVYTHMVANEYDFIEGEIE